jgi:hypothetical protein
MIEIYWSAGTAPAHTYVFCPACLSRPLERTLSVSVEEADEKDEEEYDDLHQGGPSDLTHHNGPGIEKNQLDVENEEDEREEVIADIELDPGLSGGRDTTLIRLSFLRIPTGFQYDPGNEYGYDGKGHGCEYEHDQ